MRVRQLLNEVTERPTVDIVIPAASRVVRRPTEGPQLAEKSRYRARACFPPISWICWAPAAGKIPNIRVLQGRPAVCKRLNVGLSQNSTGVGDRRPLRVSIKQTVFCVSKLFCRFRHCLGHSDNTGRESEDSQHLFCGCQQRQDRVQHGDVDRLVQLSAKAPLVLQEAEASKHRRSPGAHAKAP
jgi:hypothetical protein